ncbi:LapA family protein [Amylibacter sp. SFDW26]|uniref:LapA family protein n=1 Tax=Amylibacter sp. SFDW26 TaxID=2652722 RepID=UPI00126173B9|nr:LapA family protein [Amylibacter sp. SFDW26]KAB7613367.1 LapA family protein [Amylibacter sp. SFDW26]
MRFIRYFFLGAIALVLIIVAVANRQPVQLQLLPEDLAAFVPFAGSITVPLFLVIFAGVLGGLLIGFVWEYLREFKIRNDLSKSTKQVKSLEREVGKLRAKTGEGQDEILALLD